MAGVKLVGYDVKYTDLRIRQDVTEVTGVADVTLNKGGKIVSIQGLPPRLEVGGIEVSCPDAITDVHSIIDPSDSHQLLSNSPLVRVKMMTEEVLSGTYHQGGGPYGGSSVVDEDGAVTFLPNTRAIHSIEKQDSMPTTTLLRINYNADGALGDKNSMDSTITVDHLVEGLGFSEIIYDLGIGDGRLCLSPYVFIKNNSSLDFKDVSVTLVMPDSPKPSGNEIRRKISLQQRCTPRSEDFDFKLPPEMESLDQRGVRSIRRIIKGGPEAAFLGHVGVDEVCLEETIEGSVANVDTKGTFSLERGRSRKVRLAHAEVDGVKHSNVLMLNTAEIDEGHVYRASIEEAVRFTPDVDVKAGCFFYEGQCLQFPAMTATQESELLLRTCKNLYARVAMNVRHDLGTPGRGTAKCTYDVVLVNDTGSDQEVEINIPASRTIPTGAKLEWDFKTENLRDVGTEKIMGEEYYVLKAIVGAKSTEQLSFSLSE